MREFINRLILLLISTWLLLQHNTDVTALIALLIAVISISLYPAISSRKLKAALILAYIIASFFLPLLVFFIPALIYDIYSDRFYWASLGIIPCLVYVFSEESKLVIVPLILLAAVSLVLSITTDKLRKLEREYISQRDSSTEMNMVLKEKNKTLMQNQDYEIRVATLGERNRIAREIHDNVGHMLSRSILQMGALMAIHKEEPLHEQLSGVNETLNQAMNSIRESVHGLRDDSLDLNQVCNDILTPLRESYSVRYQYDMSDEVDRDVKFCFIAIIKEATSNFVKHSSGNTIDIILREQPAFYQLSVEDNGSVSRSTHSDGMGLQNMQDRVAALGGIIHINSDKGFKIFISIPKKTN
ncbi:MAG: histidine kinase [Lachnospiraceae bacterium]|nr:histidine kinase [Lachnospiraceae bacterium]